VGLEGRSNDNSVAHLFLRPVVFVDNSIIQKIIGFSLDLNYWGFVADNVHLDLEITKSFTIVNIAVLQVFVID
jgi:hypothetical protein